MDETFETRLIDLLPRLRRFALSLSRTPDIADDLVQEACERALDSAAAGDDIQNFEAFLFRIVRNLWYDRLRRRRVRGEEVDVQDHPDLLADHGGLPAERRMLLSKVAAEMERLPDDQRELMLLVCVEEMSYRDAADVLGIPIGTVMSRLSRARRRIIEATGLTGADL